MEETSELVCTSEFIQDRLYFVTLITDDDEEKPKYTPNTHFFNIDKELQYESFFKDFGPLNISMLYHYCTKLNKKLKSVAIQKKKIVHFTTGNAKKRANAAFLIGSFSIIYLNFTPEQAYEVLNRKNPEAFTLFRDASIGATAFYISLLDCLKAIHKALKYGFFNFDSFDFLEYEHYERVENGDLNWILPNKFIAFCGPHNRSRMEENEYPLHSPETYFSYFRRHNVTTIIRLNKKVYDSNKFVNAGFEHKDLYFIDGSTPSDPILDQFIAICERTVGVVAVHCKAGLGRTGSLIGCFIMKHYKMTAHETIAWIRICRPGSIIGHQQAWLESKQAQMWREGEIYRRKNRLDSPVVHIRGIYNFENDHNEKLTPSITKQIKQNDNVSRILKKVDTMKLMDNMDDDNDNCNVLEEDKIKSSPITQGDKLNQIKALRRQARTTPVLEGNKMPARVRSRLVTTSTLESPVLRGTKLVSIGSKVPSTSSSRVLTKRNKLNEMQPLQSLTPRRTRSTAPQTLKTATVSKSSLSSTENNENGFTVTLNGIESPRKNTVLKSVKRSKRTLTNEKEKGNSRGVKVLRRFDPIAVASKQPSNHSPTQTSSQLHLPTVKVSKSKTP